MAKLINVIGLMNENKEILIRYEYNSYGEVTITKGSNISISKENPFRYKCYYD